MACAFTTRIARSARWVATATAWAFLGTQAIHAAPPARTVTFPPLDPLTATAHSLKLFAEDRLAYMPGAVDGFHEEGSRVGPPNAISADPASVFVLPCPPRPCVPPVRAKTWDGAIHIAVPSNDQPDSAWGPALPPLTSNREEYGNLHTTDVVWRPDMPVVAFLLTGLAVAFLRRRSAFAPE